VPNVKQEMPKAIRRQTAAEKRSESTGLCKNCGNKITFCGRPFNADIKCSKCNNINQFLMSQQPVSCVAVDC
jgi:hypothetical protein